MCVKNAVIETREHNALEDKQGETDSPWFVKSFSLLELGAVEATGI